MIFMYLWALAITIAVGCQTAKPANPCAGLQKQIDDLKLKVSTLEAEAEIAKSTPNDMIPDCIDRD